MVTANDRILQVFADEFEALHCARCKTLLHVHEVAMLVRTRPSEAFTPWCPTCTLFITYHAASDLGYVDLTGTM